MWRHRRGLALLPLLFGRAASGSPFRAGALEKARAEIAVLDGDRATLTGQHVDQGVTTYISTWEEACAGSQQPLEFVDFQLPGARPVDVFNVLTDQLATPHWLCNGCSVSRLGNWCERQSVGYVQQFSQFPFQDRVFYQWQVVAANESTDPAAVEYMVAFTSDENAELIARKPAPDNVVVAENCVVGYRIRGNGAGGAHVAAVTHSNMHMGQVSARKIYDEFYSKLVEKCEKLVTQATMQRQKGWNDTRTAAPGWMLSDDVNCQGVDADEGISETASATTTNWMVYVPIIVGAVLLLCCLCCACAVCWALWHRDKRRSRSTRSSAGSSSMRSDSDSDGEDAEGGLVQAKSTNTSDGEDQGSISFSRQTSPGEDNYTTYQDQNGAH